MTFNSDLSEFCVFKELSSTVDLVCGRADTWIHKEAKVGKTINSGLGLGHIKLQL